MKTIINSKMLLSAFAGIFLLFAASCTKVSDVPQNTTQNVTASLKTSESYALVLPKSTNDNAFQITTVASHSSASQITTDAAGNLVYQYSPAASFTGVDHVVISTVKNTTCPNHANAPQPQHDCNNQHTCQKGGSTTINIDLTVLKDN